MESQIVNNQNKPQSLYVHIPFCDHICHYCDFTKMLTNPQKTMAYVNAVIAEIHHYHITQVATIFFGGGTPTALPLPEFKTLLEAVQPLLQQGGEWTIECNVENTSLEKLQLMQAFGVTRLSFGVQTFQEAALVNINRRHSKADVIHTLNLAKQVGFDNINIDLIYDLPKVDDDALKQDLQAFLALDVNHISTYALTIHPHTVFGIRKVKQASDEDSRRHYEIIDTTLHQAGYQRYEVSNYARDQAYCRHNLTYWHNQAYYGIGLGASGYLDGVRYINTKNINRYLLHQWRDKDEFIDPRMREFEYIMLHLRMTKGFTYQDFFNQFNHDFLSTYHLEVQDLEKRGLINKNQESFALTFEGIMLLDSVVVTLTKHHL
jgi:oxygen-independent coproporphyrinogen-3 oxidase